MKKLVPYSIGLIAILVLLVLVFVVPPKVRKKPDERITLQQKDKIPYGTFVTHQLLPHLFPKAKINFTNSSPGPWHTTQKQFLSGALIFFAKTFDPSFYDLQQMASFAKQGNYVFIISSNLSYRTSQFLKVAERFHNMAMAGADSLQVELTNPPYIKQILYAYPGKRLDGYFTFIDKELDALTLGNDGVKAPNFVQINIGKGKILVNLAPLAFSNYFLLYQNNIGYYQKAMSLIPPQIKNIYWNEYYLVKQRSRKEKNASPLSVLLQYPSFRAALFTAMGLMVFYTLMEMRRRQRMIPALPKATNDSLEFVRTIGRLYYDQKDHRNLGKKMAGFFLEHVRQHYKLQTTTFDHLFIESLQAKSGFSKPELEKIVFFINYLDDASMITEDELAKFYRQLELFYQTT